MAADVAGCCCCLLLLLVAAAVALLWGDLLTVPDGSAPAALPRAGYADPSQLCMSSCYPTLPHIVIIGSGIVIIIVIVVVIGSGMTTRRDEHAAHHFLASDWFGDC